MKKSILIGLILLFVLPSWAHAEDFAVSAQSAALYDPLTGTFLFEKNASVRRGIASTTKIMTAVAALQQYEPSQMVTILPEWCGIEGSSMELRPGEKMQVSDLLYGLLLESGNDAATALAGMHPEGAAGFVARMNEIASELGLSDTHFDNASGLDGPTHYSTARDLAKLTAFALNNPEFARIVATESVFAANRSMHNHNRLLKEIGACGVKTGFTKSCGRCLVSAKEENGRMLVAVTLNDPDDWDDHAALYERGFSQYQPCNPVGAGDCGSVPLIAADHAEARLYCNEGFSCCLQPEESARLRIVLCGPRFCYAPVKAGERYGALQVWLGGRLLFETPVYFANDCAPEPAAAPGLLEKIRMIWRKFSFERTTSENPFICGNLFPKSG